jgi:DNA adenine methylase
MTKSINTNGLDSHSVSAPTLDFPDPLHLPSAPRKSAEVQAVQSGAEGFAPGRCSGALPLGSVHHQAAALSDDSAVHCVNEVSEQAQLKTVRSQTASVVVGRSANPNRAASVPPSEQAQISAAPIVKWVGGKTRLLPELLRWIPSSYGRYYEPFAGGAALFFRLAPQRAVLSDANADLIAMYRAVADDVDHLIVLLRLYQRDHSETQFYGTRELFNRNALTPTQRAAAFIYLNKTCFNGLYRVNKAGAFNVPIGDYKLPTILDEPALRAAALVLARAELRAGDYRNALCDARDGDFVYLDPPYDDTFNAYTTDKFDQSELAGMARMLDARGVHVMLSNSDTPLVRELYADFQIERVRAARSVNSDGAGRGDVDELIITNRPNQTRSKSMGRQAELPGVESPDRIPEVEDAIYALLDAKTNKARANKENSDDVKNKQTTVDTSFTKHKIDSHPYTCPKTGKPKRFWFATEKKAKSSSIAQPHISGRRGRRGGPRRDVDAQIAGETEPKEDTTIEMRRVPRKSVEKEIDGFASVRERMEAKKVDAEKQAAKLPRGKKGK